MPPAPANYTPLHADGEERGQQQQQQKQWQHMQGLRDGAQGSVAGSEIEELREQKLQRHWHSHHRITYLYGQVPVMWPRY